MVPFREMFSIQKLDRFVKTAWDPFTVFNAWISAIRAAALAISVVMFSRGGACPVPAEYHWSHA
jgi:hypothetical protein